MNEKIKKLVASMSDEELCAEVLCWEFRENLGKRALEKFIKENSVKSFFYPSSYVKEQGDWIIDTVKKHSGKMPLVMSDLNMFAALSPELAAPAPMASGAADDCDLLYNIGLLSARAARSLGVNLLQAPVLDINYNFNNPSVNVRAVSDSPERVYKISSAYAKGLRGESRIGVCAKHFPGDGVDDRNQHFCTTENSMTMSEWWSSFGETYKKMIEDGLDAIMVGHISLPAYGVECDELGPLPSSLSHRIITDLLKGELGFSGCVVSAAMSMIGVSSRASVDRIVVDFFRAGGDFLLYPERGDYQRLLSAVKSGVITKERITDAVSRVLALKDRLGLLEYTENPALSDEDRSALVDLTERMAEKSMTLIRNYDGILPLSLGKYPRVLQINISYGKKNERTNAMPALTAALEDEGIYVDFMTNPTHYRVDNVVNGYDAVILACDIAPKSCSGSSLRIDWNNIMAFWRGYALRNKKVVFVSFGDPYKLYDLPFLRTYVNAYSSSPCSQSAAVKAILGRIPFEGKSPIGLPGFFEREGL